MTNAMTLMTTLFSCLDERRWGDIPALLADDFLCTYTHTGERFDCDGFVRLNADYPVRVRLMVEQVLADGDQAVVRARVFNDEAHHVASFGTAADGLLVSLVEVWAEDTGDASRTPRARTPPTPG
ncbi:MAG: hypothetical protein ACR2FG_10895 [Marmoricola sp.]